MESKNIEVEFRTLLTEGQHLALMDFLLKNGEDLGQDDKDTYFFIFKDKLLKVVNNLSKKSGKIVLKLNKLGNGSDFEEIEIPIAKDQVDRTAKLFKLLNLPAQLIHNEQKRRNFTYKGVEISVKHSNDWGYHAELEIVVGEPKEKEAAVFKIEEIAKELGLKLMTDEEIFEFTQRIEEDYRKRKI